MDEHVYASDPHAAPDSDFEPGALEHLVEGSAGRLLDPRRTPVTVRGIDEATGTFSVEIGAFEDAGARWEIPFEDVTRFQFARSGGERATAAVQARMRAAVDRLDHQLTIEPDRRAAAATEERLREQRHRARAALDARDVPARLDPAPSIEQRRGDPALTAAVRAALGELADMDDAFARRYVSNPWSGELVKGHAIVAAELGLAGYAGKIVRDPHLFDVPWTKHARAEHLIARLALTQELWRRAGADTVTLYRAAADAAAPAGTFVSATFARAVAEAHERSHIHELVVPLDRLLMTFWETAAFNDPYREAEALLISRRRCP